LARFDSLQKRLTQRLLQGFEFHWQEYSIML
jgi:hypothetical protein